MMPAEYDVVVIGAGAAGLSAGIYCANQGLRTVILESSMAGNQIVNTEKIENFPGVPPTSGATLVAELLDQATNAGAEFIPTQANAISRHDPHRVVSADAGDYRAKAVILAAGSTLRRLGVPGEEELWGKGVSLCATCDGPLFQDVVVAVVGGGDSAADEALTLTEYAREVFLIHRGAELRAQEYLQARIRRSTKIRVLLNTFVERVIGEEAVSGLRLRDRSAQEDARSRSRAYSSWWECGRTRVWSEA